MTKLFRTSFIFLLLLSSRASLANPLALEAPFQEEQSKYSLKGFPGNNHLGLSALPTASYLPLRQNSNDLDTLYAQAFAAQIELAELLQPIAEQTRVQVQLPQIKSYRRAHQKVQLKFAGDAGKITDLSRASLIADTIHDLMSAYKALNQRMQIVQLKNRFAAPKASGYRDLNLLVKLPRSGMIAEVQLHLRDIAAIKNGAEHRVYEQVQALEATAIEQQRPLSEFELAQIARLRQASHKLYHKAWLSYKRQDEAMASHGRLAYG
ncbi:RelA/SpoT domain-containing protein [Shewanella salipaludis]|uniref:RelA/SpoT domain-containing protein n=1 Tax=Shewanella salipaludis TaxID=2723052 RepID=A0A972JKP3_9GAMM|nr:RelA/SpoT domain-containing protein [Shewanella salipaludis]NMH66410.1 RelA/SpoT domain-containing protein [Shewanella salipaludis]